MNKINVLLANSNGNLRNTEQMIKEAVREAEPYVFSRLNINWDIDLMITNHMPFVLIPEDGIGGRTYWSDLITICVDEEKLTKSKMTEMLVHELCHAARWGKNNEWMNTLFDGLINEGIATYFESEFAKNLEDKTVFIKTILERSDEENKKIFEKLRDQLESSSYDYEMIFFNGNDELPRWAGYSLGYYLVKKYLKKTGKKIEDAFADKYADFRAIVL
jgi:hypothetical protein